MLIYHVRGYYLEGTTCSSTLTAYAKPGHASSSIFFEVLAYRDSHAVEALRRTSASGNNVACSETK